LAGTCLAASPILAQQRDTTTTVAGVVVDAVTGDEVRGALVHLDGEPYAVATDTLGVFVLRGVPKGAHTLVASQFGYEPASAHLDVAIPQAGYLEVDLEPSPLAIEGVVVVARRLASFQEQLQTRSLATGQQLSVLDAQKLTATRTHDVAEFLAAEAAITTVPCDNSPALNCVMRRGRAFRPIVCVDEALAPGGFAELASYKPEDLYRIEVYSAGAQIRIYTHAFVAHMVERPQLLLPNGFGC
jgi:hypothetical protein